MLNPYKLITEKQNGCLSAVRSMLAFIPPPGTSNVPRSLPSSSPNIRETTPTPRSSNVKSFTFSDSHDGGKNISETQIASRLAEGTIYSLRDRVLDEAIELNFALQFWTERWENPFLSWLEAGPFVWFSKEGYNHDKIGQRVSQIQAVLAQRCASVGELQQHLWRAGWQRGVAHWGVIGEGWKWATVVGEDGRSLDNDVLHPVVVGNETLFLSQSDSAKSMSAGEDEPLDHIRAGPGGGALRRSASAEIVSNEPALAAWTVDAIRMVRTQLYEQDDEHRSLIHFENWPREWREFGNSPSKEVFVEDYTPLWAMDVDKEVPRETIKHFDKAEIESCPLRIAGTTRVTISNLPLMAEEVSDLLSVMEAQATEQRENRLKKNHPPSKLYRNWYVVCGSLPILSYVVYKVLKDGWGSRLCKQIFVNIKEFYSEHVADPVTYIYTQIFSSRGAGEISAADEKARLQAIESLKKMLQDWVDQTFPNMSSSERRQIAESMDMSLIEKKKEESVKNALYEISDIVRMSLIEMQFVKKELMNAMVSMDELMQSNEFNFKLAAMTPAFILVYGTNRLFRYLFYSLLSLGRSREQVHESVRLVVLDIERLLVMRDCPPTAPPLQGLLAKGESVPRMYSSSDMLRLRGDFYENETSKYQTSALDKEKQENVLNSVDLGMLLLLIHECRTAMLKNRRRFTKQEHRSMAEDLAELSGERGPVSVKQQLSIISRMFRTYSFLKVLSSGVTVDVSRYNA